VLGHAVSSPSSICSWWQWRSGGGTGSGFGPSRGAEAVDHGQPRVCGTTGLAGQPRGGRGSWPNRTNNSPSGPLIPVSRGACVLAMARLVYGGAMTTDGQKPGGSPGTTKKATTGNQDAARLVLLSGGEIGRRYTLAEVSVIGRDEGATIFLDDAEVSRKHAVIARSQPGRYTITDLDSSNGTLVNGQRVESGELSFGDRIQVGSHEMLFARHSPVDAQIIERQRFEALGRLAAGICHDFNNMLGVAMAGTDYLSSWVREAEPDDPEVTACVEDINVAVERASALSRRLVEFGRSGQGGYEEVDLSALCKELAALLRRSFPTSVELESTLEPRVTVMGHSPELQQVLMNLMINARDAMPDGGTLRLSVERCREGRSVHAVLRVQDDGIGMDEETRSSIFEPFFSTKGSEGFGLGLANVREIVALHGGEISVESAPGEGATFEIRLPSIATIRPSVRLSRRVSTPPPALTVPATILVVDHEEMARRAAERLLSRAGYSVMVAEDGRRAVKCFMESEQAPEVVFLDLDMPHLDGDRTLKLIRGLDRNVPVVMCSTHVDQAKEAALIEQGVECVVRKPYGEEELLGPLRRILRSRRARLVEDEPTFVGDGWRDRGSGPGKGD
jgi:signal transduction histidine kinase/CheY-like chemotaxis protein